MVLKIVSTSTSTPESNFPQELYCQFTRVYSAKDLEVSYHKNATNLTPSEQRALFISLAAFHRYNSESSEKVGEMKKEEMKTRKEKKKKVSLERRKELGKKGWGGIAFKIKKASTDSGELWRKITGLL